MVEVLSALIGMATTIVMLWVALRTPFIKIRRRMFSTFLLEHIGAIVRLHLPLPEGLQECGNRASSASRRDLRHILRSLDEGWLLGDALAAVPRPDGAGSRLIQWLRDMGFLPGPFRLVKPAEAEAMRIGEMSGNLSRAVATRTSSASGSTARSPIPSP